jgi:hypothetical protein
MVALIGCAVLALPSRVRAQQRSAREFRWAKSLRAGQWVRIHNISGDVTVRAADGDRVEVVGTRRGDYDDDLRMDVHEDRDGVTICALYGDDSRCDERGMHNESHGDDRRHHGSIDFEVRLPRRLKLSANSVSGDVDVSGAGDEVHAASVSGNVKLQGLRSPAISAVSVSGDVDARVDALTGAGDLRFTSVSGNVTLELPRSLDADVTLSTVSGELDTDFQMVVQGPYRRRGLQARIGRGGRELKLTTVSGDVRLRAR